MESTEKYGVDVDEAVRLALEELNLTEDQVMVTVLEEPKKAVLGLGGKLAKVKVEKLAGAAASRSADSELSQNEVLSQAEQKTSKAKHDFRKRSRGAEHAGETGFTGDSSEISSGYERPQRGGSRSGGYSQGRRSGGYDRNNGRRNRYDFGDLSGIEIDLSKIPSVSEPIENLVPDPENPVGLFLGDVLAKMGLNVEVESSKNDECIYLDVKGEDVRLAIGKRGQTLDALQYLASLVLNKGGGDYKRVVVNAEGYRSKREKAVEELAIKCAKGVLKSGRTLRLEPMNPFERKIIHATLQHIDGVTTKSDGVEPYRRVIIERE